MVRFSMLGAICLLVVSAASTAPAAEPPAEPAVDSLDGQFQAAVQPFVASYCGGCHGKAKAEAKLDLTAFTSPAGIGKAHHTWELVLQRLEAGEMPPEEAKRQPAAAERQAVVAWIKAFRRQDAERNAGDPGIVPVRRLSNAEYNYTVRDLTGVDIRPTKEFPVDPAGEAGFDNTAQSLAMSPALLKKYVGAARLVADHLVLKPSGFAFAPHPVMTDTDRDKYCVKRIVEFYQRQPTDYAAYFLAAWRYQHRAALAQPQATLDDIAASEHVSPKYLAIIWRTLALESQDVGPLARLKAMWRELPAPTAAESDQAARRGCENMRDFVVRLRRKLEPKVDDLDVDGIHKGAQAFVLWKNDQYAANRRRCRLEALQTAGEENTDQDLVVPADPIEHSRHEAAFARFASIFPDAFYISERGRDYVGKSKDQQEKGRLLSAGFHSMMGYYRDDGPLCDLVLDDAQNAELDALWQELDFVTSAPMRQYAGFVWFERTDSRFLRDAEFDFARAEDKDVTSEDKIRRLAETYLAKAERNGGVGVPIRAIEDYFREMNAQVRWVEAARLAAEPSHLEALAAFAERAYRRPLTASERDELLAFYRKLREREQLTHEEAIQDAIVFVLMSPDFCYRMDLASAGDARRRLTDYELASRLSYFLWASMPDQELLAHAAAGDLHEAPVLLAQMRRMLADDRVRGLALEFAGNWLDFRRFESHGSVDRQRFPSFTGDLRQAMFEEPLRFFIDVAQHDRSVLDLLYGRHTFVNDALARHYGLDVGNLQSDQWVQVDDATPAGRGGLLAMSVFLTQNSPGLRTSPVKRGYWVARRLLGERIPPPPPSVPELPADEAKLGELTLRETLARHRNDKNCAACHERFDSLGLVFEGYGPIGERRQVDLGGHPIDARAAFPGGSEGEGLEGLRTYLREHRQEDFLDNLCRKLLSYALGRSLLPSDDALVGQMRKRLSQDAHRFTGLVETIVASPQFLIKWGQ